jgi:hypothetical protein
MTAQRSPVWSRTLHRRLHLVLASILGLYLYSPLGAVETVGLLVEVVVFPTLALSGILLWRGTQLRRWIGRTASGGGSDR